MDSQLLVKTIQLLTSFIIWAFKEILVNLHPQKQDVIRQMQDHQSVVNILLLAPQAAQEVKEGRQEGQGNIFFEIVFDQLQNDAASFIVV